MIKYKVTFEIENRMDDSLITDSSLNKKVLDKVLSAYHVLYKSYVKDMIIDGIELQYDDLDKIEVTHMKIEEVEEND